MGVTLPWRVTILSTWRLGPRRLADDRRREPGPRVCGVSPSVREWAARGTAGADGRAPALPDFPSVKVPHGQGHGHAPPAG